MTSMFIKVNGETVQFKPKRSRIASDHICERAYQPITRFYEAMEHGVFHLLQLHDSREPDRILQEWVLTPKQTEDIVAIEGDVFSVHQLVVRGIPNHLDEEGA